MTQYVIGEADHQTAVLSDSRGLPLFFQGKNILAIKDVFPLAEKRGCFHATINQVDASDTAYDQRVVCVWSDDGVVKFAPIPSK